MRTISLLLLVLAACKGETKIQIDPQTQKDLDAANEKLATLRTEVTQLREENTKLQTKQAPGEITVAFEDKPEKCMITVRPGKPGEPVRPIDDKATELASKQFYDLVRKSRGAIQKCYEQQLKKTSGLQSKTITMYVKASFTQTGAYQSSSFSPSIGDTFDTCMKSVASNWKLPQNSIAMTFQAPVTLTPL
jgi:hypothetical protein